MEIDASDVAQGAEWSAALCIVGAGPAGLAVAEALRETGRPIVVLERASRSPEADDAPLLHPANEADAEAFAATHAWGVGGTATIWNTMIAEVAWAKYVALDTVDFQRRSWVPHSGWPFDAETLAPWYLRAHVMCGTGAGSNAATLASASEVLQRGRYHLGPASRFTTELPAALARASNVQLVRGAVATGLERSRSGRIVAVHWRSAAPRGMAKGAERDIVRGIVRANAFVLAAGALENARFLLADAVANQGLRHGAARSSVWLGSAFMEHPIDHSLLVRARRRSGSVAEPLHGPLRMPGEGIVVGRLGFDPELLRAERLPNMSLRAEGGVSGAEGTAVLPAPSKSSRQSSLQSPLRSNLRRLVPSARLRRLLGDSARRVLRLRSRLRPVAMRLFLDLEQWPRPENRVVLNGRHNRLGEALATVHWTWNADEEAMRLHAQEVVRRELERHALGVVEVHRDRPLNPHAHHHAGTTRMHDDPTQGVVDATLRVHGEENLYVAGASVFPTAGVANPTLTIVALSLRLADHLRRFVLGAVSGTPSGPSDSAPGDAPGDGPGDAPGDAPGGTASAPPQ